ncbi:MAG TPA: FkbM family methyltransferase [Bryobacteraceae bacterium]
MTSPLEFAYTTVLRPRPVRGIVNSALRAITPRTLKRRGATIVLNPNDPVISGALTLGCYELQETAFFLKACRPGVTFLDIGANVGYYTALALSKMNGNGRVIALEPDPESFRYLQATAAANGGSIAVCVQKAAARHHGRMTLFTSHDNRGDNRLYSNELAQGSCEVETAPVDDILKSVGSPTVDLVKMDVQGFEPYVLAGMHRTIQRSPRMILLTEFWPHGIRSAGADPAQFLTGMERLGFRLYELSKKTALAPVLEHSDLIARLKGRRYKNLVGIKGSAHLE